MGSRIEKTWGAILGNYLVRGKNNQQGHNPKQQKQSQQEKNNSNHPDLTREELKDQLQSELKKLVEDVEFSQTGIQLEVQEFKSTYNVVFRQKDGSHIRTISGQDFLNLRQASNDEHAGKILDQRF